LKILVTGGCGYVGTQLVKKLLKLNCKVIVIDTMWFGDFLKPNKNLKKIKLDIRNTNKIPLKNIDTIIHLAAIANDPMSELDHSLSWDIGTLSTFNLLQLAKKYKVKNFIYASSGSVYGVKKEKFVHENLNLDPISLYNKTKMCSERIVLSFKNEMNVKIIRPATVCGYSPRMRFDVSVNALTSSAFLNKKIIVQGGDQIRPNIHIDDLTDLYLYFLEKKIKGIIYNAGFENLSIKKIAKTVQKHVNSEIIFQKTILDPRSYRLDSSKLLKTGFKPKKKVEDAIQELHEMFLNKKIKNNASFYSIKWLKNNELFKK
tara:strand:+ start:232 stop:1179 length:948 start_codon:yes stop_codon:yes gene_type:complete